MITDLFSVFTVVGPFSKHALVGNDTHCEVVDRYSMILAAHNLWCHVAWRSWSIFWILRVPKTSDSQVSYAEITLLVKDKIFRFDVSV